MEDSMEGIESEDVKIGDWEGRLPSDICTNRKIFDEIFSLNTWNNVLGSEQRERLIEMLPKEVSASPEMLKQTIEELFNGSLTIFSQSPMDNFYGLLESGQFDPIVTDMKANIRREQRKESIRQLQNYHTKLLEDIVVSRQRYLTRLKARVIPLTNKSRSKPTNAKSKAPKTKKQTGVGVLQNVLQNASSELNTKLSGTIGGDKPKPQISNKPIIKVEDDYVKPSPIPLPTVKKRKGKEDPSDIVDGGKPAPKKKTNPKPKPTILSTDKSGSRVNKTGTELSVQTDKNNTHTPQPVLKVENCSNDVKQQEPSSCIIVTTPSPTTPTTCFVTHSSTDSILNAALTSDKLLKTSTPTNSSSIYTSPTKSSPILASQLQASPQVSVKMEDSLNFFSSESDSGCITLNYQKMEDKSSDDELETSSDEFEAIQPTIGFGTSLPASTITGMLSPGVNTSTTLAKVILSPGNTLQTLPSSTLAPNVNAALTNRIIQVPSLHQQDNSSSGNSYVTVTVSSAGNKLPHTSPVYILSTKTLSEGQQPHGRIIQIPKEAIKSIPISSQQLALLNTPKIIVTAGTSTIDQQQFQKSVASTQPQEIIRISNADLLNAKSSGSVHYVTNSGKNLILHPVSSTNVNQPTVKIISNGSQLISSNMASSTTSYTNLNMVTSSSDIGGVQFVTNTNQQLKLNDNNLSLNSSSLLESDELNLSLSSLGSLGLGMGMNVSNMSSISAGSLDGIMDNENMKLEMDVIDKIDDLSVLDGNFDSIPNLSDELDGLDLDLVDGLCDFEGLLSDEKKYPSFFTLIREVLCSTRDHRMTLLCLEKTVRKWAASPGAALNPWFLNVSDWNNALVTALNFLAGTYQDHHPEDFVPYIEYKYKTKYYQWIGAGRDGDNNLTPLCTIWMENLDRLPSIKKIDGETEDQEEEDEENEDSELTEDAKKKNKRPVTPPPPRCVTDWTVRPSTDEEKNLFRVQERSRFDNPHKAFTYTMHCYESVVGPVKGVYSTQVGMTNKARGHSLLTDDRPPYVTILALVRDAVARLPNGEGTRSEICEMLRDSAFLAPDASSVTLNSVVSGALDRLHYERDPCVRYDSHKKSWIYLHRDRTQDQFERLHHNRSYTKSTKSRNNTSRKSRRSSTKAPTPTSTTTTSSTVGSVDSTCSTPTTSTSPISTTADNSITGMEEQPALPPEPIKVITNVVPQINQGLPAVSNAENSSATTPRAEIIVKSEAPTNTVLQTIKLTPLPSQQGDAPVVKSNTVVSPPVESPGVPKASQFLVQTSPSSVSPVTQNTIQLQSGRAVQIQGFPSIATTSTGETVVVSGIQTVTTPTATTQGQMVFAPQTVLRIANALRLSPMRLPGMVSGNTMVSGNAMPGNVRVPQRILLTRSTVPGQSQGILLGHTSTGQTVILSTTGGNIGSFQTLPTSVGQGLVHAQIQQHEASAIVSAGSEVSTTQSPSPTLTTYSLRQMLGKPQSSPILTSSPTRPLTTTQNITTGSMFDINSPQKMLQLNISGVSASPTAALLKSTTTTANSQPSATALHIPSQTTQGDFIITSSAQTPAGVHPQRHPVGYTIATVRGNPITLQQSQSQPTTLNRTIGGQTIQLQALSQNQMIQSILSQNQATVSTTSSGDNTGDGHMTLTPNNSTPIIIRSVQGDLMLPGHIALGKGGIKLFPFPVGNKTMLAKIIPPSSQSTPRLPMTVSISTPTTVTTTDIPITTSSSSAVSATPSTTSPCQTQQ